MASRAVLQFSPAVATFRRSRQWFAFPFSTVDKRLDEWVSADKFRFDTLAVIEQPKFEEMGDVRHAEFSRIGTRILISSIIVYFPCALIDHNRRAK